MPAFLLIVGVGLGLLFWLVVALFFIVPLVWLFMGLLAVPTNWEMVQQGGGAFCLVCFLAYLFYLDETR